MCVVAISAAASCTFEQDGKSGCLIESKNLGKVVSVVSPLCADEVGAVSLEGGRGHMWGTQYL